LKLGLLVEPLSREHAVERFACGEPQLDEFLIRFALTGQQSNSSRTYVALDGRDVVGYYTLVASEVAHAHSPERLTKGMARHPIPLMLLARLAVHRDHQGKKLGAGLLVDAMSRTLEASKILGIRALAVDAKNEAAENFYLHFGFIPSPVDPRHLYLLLKDVQRVVGR
jgi:GNAT superfamily N-acetyltransferase